MPAPVYRITLGDRGVPYVDDPATGRRPATEDEVAAAACAAVEAAQARPKAPRRPKEPRRGTSSYVPPVLPIDPDPYGYATGRFPSERRRG